MIDDAHFCVLNEKSWFSLKNSSVFLLSNNVKIPGKNFKA